MRCFFISGMFSDEALVGMILLQLVHTRRLAALLHFPAKCTRKLYSHFVEQLVHYCTHSQALASISNEVIQLSVRCVGGGVGLCPNMLPAEENAGGAV